MVNAGQCVTGLKGVQIVEDKDKPHFQTFYVDMKSDELKV